MPVRELLVILALAAATAIVAYAVLRGLSAQPERRFEEAYELKKALLAGRLSGAVVSVEARPMAINLTIDGVKYQVPAARVYVAFRATGPAFEEATPEPWRVWGNGTHAGAISYLDIADDGVTVTVTYYSATPEASTPSICVLGAGQVTYSLQAKNGGTIAFYSFKGPRKVVVSRVQVGRCR